MPLKKPKACISDKDRYDMRKMRVTGRTIRDIAVAKKVPYRQAYEAVADIKPGAKYTEEELKGSHLWEGIPEQSDEPQTREGQDMSQNTMDPEDEFHSYLNAQAQILDYIRVSIKIGD
jgi:argininosuccinate lyase